MKQFILFNILICAALVLISSNVSAGSLLPLQPALAVNNMWLFPDTSLSAVTDQTVQGGTLLEVLGKSQTEQLDKDQNQQYFWYYVKTPAGKKGWVYGDAVAILQKEESLPDNLRRLHRKPVSMGAGFEDATVWFAAIEGHDSKEYRNAFYGEYYLIVTNAAKRSTFVRFAGKSAQGNTTLRQFFWQDLTGDGQPEVIFESGRKEDGEDIEHRTLDVYAVQNGAFRKVFSENMTLLDGNGFPAPSLFKCADLELKTIRLEYVDFLSCSKYAQPYSHEVQSATQEQCMEFVTYSYVWNNRASKFDLLYEPSRTAISVAALNFGVSVRKTASLSGELVALLSEGERLQVIQLFDKIVVEKGIKKIEPYLFVRTQAGVYGYVSASKVEWLKTQHAKVLKRYCADPPLMRTTWKIDFPFVRILTPGGSMGARN